MELVKIVVKLQHNIKVIVIYVNYQIVNNVIKIINVIHVKLVMY